MATHDGQVPGRRAPVAPAAAPPPPPVFKRSMLLLTVAGMWSPPASAPKRRRRLFAAYSLAFGVFTLLNALGEMGGTVSLPSGSLERTCQNICSSLWRLLAFAMWVLFRHHVRSIQALVAEAERLASVDHGLHGLLRERVEALQRRARSQINNIILGYVCWFTYSSTAVVNQPFVEWLVTGTMPRPFLASNFWLLSGPDTPSKEAIMMLSQSVSQYTCTVIVTSYVTFFGGLAILLSVQARILGLMLEDIPFSEAKLSFAHEQRVRNTVTHCITFHQDILNAALELNRVLRLMLLFLFMTGLAFIATMIYQVSAVPPTSSLFMATLMILICSNTLVGVFCYSSDQLGDATEDIVHRVMASDWTYAPEPIQALLRFTVFRATKPSALWCWRVLSISRVTWLQVLNKSYSVFAVLRS